MSTNDQNQTLDIVEPSALEVMERAQIDIQIATAKKYPRSLAAVKNNMLSLATLDQETAAGCFYTLPARRGGDGKPIQGPSVRMAEIALASYGHLRAGARVIANDGKVLVAQGVCHDLQNNVCISVEVRRKVTTKDGRTFSEDMQVMAGNAACSIALRNATFRVVPLALVKPIYEQAKRLAVGDGKTLVQRRAVAVEYFVKMGVPRDRIFGALGVNGLDDVTLEHLEILTGFKTAIADGEASIDAVFPAVTPKAKADLKSMISGDGKPAGETPVAPAQEPQTHGQDVPADKLDTGEPLNRDAVMDEIKTLMLDHNVTELNLFLYAKRAKLVPEGVDELFALPTDVLAKLKYAVAGIAKKGVAA